MPSTTIPATPDSELVMRAFTAFFKFDRDMSRGLPSLELSETTTWNNRPYVVLRNADAVVAIYRFHARQDQLKKLRKPPKSLLLRYLSEDQLKNYRYIKSQ